MDGSVLTHAQRVSSESLRLLKSFSPALAVSGLRQLTPASVGPTQSLALRQRRSPGPAPSMSISPWDNLRDKRGSAAHHMSCTAADVLPRQNTCVTLMQHATNLLMCLVPLDVLR